MTPINIRIRHNGPYLISEEDAQKLVVVDHAGVPMTLPVGKKGIALCRCGGSSQKPFCDGTHNRIGFQGAVAAVHPPDPTAASDGGAPA